MSGDSKRRSIIASIRDKVAGGSPSSTPDRRHSFVTDRRRSSTASKTDRNSIGGGGSLSKLEHYFIAASQRPFIGNANSTHGVLLAQEKALGYGEFPVDFDWEGHERRESGFILLGRSGGFLSMDNAGEEGDDARKVLVHFPYHSLLEWELTSDGLLRVVIEDGKLCPVRLYSRESPGLEVLRSLLLFLDVAAMDWSRHMENESVQELFNDNAGEFDPLLYDLLAEKEVPGAFSCEETFVEGPRFSMRWLLNFTKKEDSKQRTTPAILVVSPRGLLAMVPLFRMLVPVFYSDMSALSEKKGFLSFSVAPRATPGRSISQIWQFSSCDTTGDASCVLRSIEAGIRRFGDLNKEGVRPWPVMYPPMSVRSSKVLSVLPQPKSGEEAVALNSVVSSLHEKRSRIATERSSSDPRDAFMRKFIDLQYFQEGKSTRSSAEFLPERGAAGTRSSGGILDSLRVTDKKTRRASLQLFSGNGKDHGAQKEEESSPFPGIRLHVPSQPTDSKLAVSPSAKHSSRNPSPFASDEEADIHVVVRKPSPRAEPLSRGGSSTFSSFFPQPSKGVVNPALGGRPPEKGGAATASPKVAPATASPKVAPATAPPKVAPPNDGLSGALDMLQRELAQLKADGLLSGDAAAPGFVSDDDDSAGDSQDHNAAEDNLGGSRKVVVVVAPPKPPITPQKGDVSSSSSLTPSSEEDSPRKPPPRKSLAKKSSSSSSTEECKSKKQEAPSRKTGDLRALRKEEEDGDGDDDEGEEEYSYVEEYVEVEVTEDDSPLKQDQNRAPAEKVIQDDVHLEQDQGIAPAKNEPSIPVVPPKPTIPPKPKIIVRNLSQPSIPLAVVQPEVVPIDSTETAAPVLDPSPLPVSVSETPNASASAIAEDSSLESQGGDIDSDIINSDSDVSD